MRAFIILRWLWLPLVALILPSCNQLDSISTIEDFEVQADYAIPIINSTTTIHDLLEAAETEATLINTTSDGTLSFNYQSSGPTVEAEQLFTDIPDFPFAVPNEPTSVALEIFPGVDLETLELKLSLIHI